MDDERRDCPAGGPKTAGAYRIPAGALELYHQALTHRSYSRQTGAMRLTTRGSSSWATAS